MAHSAFPIPDSRLTKTQATSKKHAVPLQACLRNCLKNYCAPCKVLGPEPGRSLQFSSRFSQRMSGNFPKSRREPEQKRDR
jgi:hypothetical protein